MTDEQDGGREAAAPRDASARLDALLRRANPAAVEAHEKTGRWPGGQAPYVIHTHAAGRRVAITTADGDTVNGAGATVSEALAALEQKLK